MKKLIQIFFIAVMYFTVGLPVFAQKAESKSDIIFKAIQDELNRTMTELNHPEAGKPFFAALYVTEGTLMNSRATLGAVLTSSVSPIAATSFRFMFGNYDMNDENFEETQNKEMVFPRTIADPIEMDYWGIRRSLWNNIDHSFKSASRNYLSKKEYFAKNPNQKPGFPDYIKQEPVIIELPEKTCPPTSFQVDSLTRALSYLLKKYEKITRSTVSFDLLKYNLYLINSEGTRLKIPFCFASVEISATLTNGGGENLSESLSFNSMEPNELMHNKTMGDKISELAGYLSKLAKAPKLEDDYSGPILFTGNTSVPKVMEALFTGKDALTAVRETVENTPAYRKNLPQSNNSMESKIGKRVMPAAFSVTMKPKLDSYNGVKLFGKTLVDYEGTIPPDEVKLIENGVLKDLLRNRVPSSRAVTSSNGHLRPSLSNSGIFSNLEPSVVLFSSSNTKSNEELEKEFIAKARDKGLDFALIVKPAINNVSDSPSAFYKVSVADGSETLIRPLSVDLEGGKMINHIAGCSNKEIVQNTMGSESPGGTVLGTPTSVIVPDALLFTDMSAKAMNTKVDKSLLPEAQEE